MVFNSWTGLCACLLTVLAMPLPAHADPLAGYRWKNRLLVIAATDAQSEKVAGQRLAYQRAQAGMSERDVVLIDAVGPGTQARAVRAHLGVGDAAFKALLIGKDGHTAAASDTPFSAADLFGRIDAMPMRRDEAGRKAR